MSDDGEDNTTSPEQRASGRARPSLAGKAGRSAACGYHAPGRSAGKAARLMVMSCGGGEGGRPTCQLPATRGLVEEPVAAHAAGNAVADRRSLPAGLGKTQRPVDRGAGGNRCQSALPCGTRRLLPTRPLERPGASRGPRSPTWRAIRAKAKRSQTRDAPPPALPSLVAFTARRSPRDAVTPLWSRSFATQITTLDGLLAHGDGIRSPRYR